LTKDSEKHEEKKPASKSKKSSAKKTKEISPDFKDSKGKSIKKPVKKSTTQARVGKVNHQQIPKEGNLVKEDKIEKTKIIRLFYIHFVKN
jgi:23S rRNA pseudouridine2604 synthase